MGQAETAAKNICPFPTEPLPTNTLVETHGSQLCASQNLQFPLGCDWAGAQFFTQHRFTDTASHGQQPAAVPLQNITWNEIFLLESDYHQNILFFPLKIKFKKENFYPSWLHRKTESMSQYIFQKVKIKKAKSPKPPNVFIKKKKRKSGDLQPYLMIF